MSDNNNVLVAKPILLSEALKSGEVGYNHELGANPPKAVSKEEFTAVGEGFFKSEDGFVLFPTSEEDMQKAREILDLQELPCYWVKTRVGNCPRCDRQNNFLDVVQTGLNVHDASFLRKVFTGEFGSILNSASHQRCECAGCGVQLPKEATKFLCQATDLSLGGSSYYFPIYTHRF